MFWTTGKNSTLEANFRYKFKVNFVNAVIDENTAKDLTYFVKNISAPSMNIDFERAYANEYVHYFQNGSIHWEPITITIADFYNKNNNNELKTYDFFFEFLKKYEILFENRTAVIDSPTLCEEIHIHQYARFASDTYPTSNDGPAGSVKLANVNDVSTYYEKMFVIKRPKLIKFDLGKFDYNSDEINEFSITVVPEWCSKN